VGETSATLSTLVNAGWALNELNQVSVQTFTTDKGERETRTFEGYNDDISRVIRNSRLLWREENIRSVQVSGDHVFPGASNSRVDWRVSFARSNRDEPDIREVLYEEIGGNFQLADESQSGFRMFNDLDEDTTEVALNWTIAFTGPRGLPAQLKVGPSYQKRQRDFSSRQFRLAPLDVRNFDLTRSPEELFSPQNIGPRFELIENTRPTDAYSAEQRVGAFFAMVDMPVSLRSRLVAGVRIENFREQVDTFDLFDVDLNEDRDVQRGEMEETDLFPAVNFVQDLGNNQNLRLSYSQTVNRPEFRELSPFEFTDIVGGRAVVGNPDLSRSLIQNVDVRWEWFPGAREVIAASMFYKHFDQPIERFVEPTAQRRTSYLNADSARNVGFELEARRALGGPFFGSANYTFVDSSITIPDLLTSVVTSLERPLSGTSKHLVNGQIEAQWPDFNARLLFNYVGDRIADIGVDKLPDIIEQGRSTLDFAASARLNERLSLRFAVDDIANREVRFLQADQEQLVYTPGRTISISLGFVGF